MKKRIKSIIRYIYRILFGESFSDKQFSLITLSKYVFYQKILRINSHIPWPVHYTTVIKEPKKIDRGTRNPGMSAYCYLDGRNGINFGKNVWVGPYVKIISMNHDTNNYKKYIKAKPIRIGDNCWIGAGAIILPGVEIGEHTVIGAGAVVTKSFPKGNQIIGGSPAKVIKKIRDYNRNGE